MKGLLPYTINVGGKLLDLSEPQVMGILNVTPDSFWEGSRKQSESEISARANQILSEGGSIIDIGACSTRPGGIPVSCEEEMKRLRGALEIVRREHPDAVISVDTFRSDVAKMSVEEYGADIINDVSEGGETYEIFDTVAKLRVPYILMSVKSTLHDMMLAFAREIQQLRDLGAKDIILDPGFGFGKTLEQNYAILAEMEKLQILELPILVGVSRKRMIWQLLGTSPAEALNGTSVINAMSLVKGASILRVHDVREAVETCKIIKAMNL